MRKLLLLFSIFLPQGLKQWVYHHLLKWNIGQRVQIGLSYIDAGHVTLSDNVRIGHFNIIRGVKRLSIGEGTYIANFNQIFGASYPNWASELTIGERVNFMSRHFIDVGGAVFIGNGCVIGGRDTQIWSHTRKLVENKPSLEPTSVRVGDDVYVGARTTLVSCEVPDGAVVGAGSVVTKRFAAESCRLLIAGNPAIVRKRYNMSSVNDGAMVSGPAEKAVD